MEQIIGFIQTVYAFIATNLGVKADVQSSTGTALARLLYIAGRTDSLFQNVLTSILGTSTGASTSYTTAHSYTGSGVLTMLSQSCFMQAGGTEATKGGYIKLTIDGTVLFDGLVSATRLMSTSATTTGFGQLVSTQIEFATSVLIEHKRGDANINQVHTNWQYKKY